jgi:hypothetical protein
VLLSRWRGQMLSFDNILICRNKISRSRHIVSASNSATSCLLSSASLTCSQVQPLLLGAGRVVLVGGFPREPSPRKVSRSFAPHARAACFCHVSHARRQWAVLRRRERARTLALCTGDSPRRR